MNITFIINTISCVNMTFIRATITHAAQHIFQFLLQHIYRSKNNFKKFFVTFHK